MAERVSRPTKVVLRLAEQLDRMSRDTARESQHQPPPFMTQRLSPAQFRTRWAQMTPFQRQQMVQQMGVAGVLQNLGLKD